MSKRHGGRLVVAGVLLAASTLGAQAKEAVKVGFIGPLTGGVSVNGLGGRNSADLAVRLRNADTKAKYQYELLVLDDECKPNVAVQQATKMAADKDVVAAATHDCSSTGSVKQKTAPWRLFGAAHSRPPCASIIEWQIDRPMPIPSGLVV